jgi:hypothetical protein
MYIHSELSGKKNENSNNIFRNSRAAYNQKKLKKVFLVLAFITIKTIINYNKL